MIDSTQSVSVDPSYTLLDGTSIGPGSSGGPDLRCQRPAPCRPAGVLRKPGRERHRANRGHVRADHRGRAGPDRLMGEPGPRRPVARRAGMRRDARPVDARCLDALLHRAGRRRSGAIHRRLVAQAACFSSIGPSSGMPATRAMAAASPVPGMLAGVSGRFCSTGPALMAAGACGSRSSTCWAVCLSRCPAWRLGEAMRSPWARRAAAARSLARARRAATRPAGCPAATRGPGHGPRGADGSSQRSSPACPVRWLAGRRAWPPG